MLYYSNCRKLPIGKIDDSIVYLDFELDTSCLAYRIYLYCATTDGYQYASRLVSLFELDRFKGDSTFILNQYFSDCFNSLFNSLKGVKKYLNFDFEVFLNGGVA